MGINLGAFVATLLCAYLGETYGWKYGFGVAGLGMLVGLITFTWGGRFILEHGIPSNPYLLEKKFFFV